MTHLSVYGQMFSFTGYKQRNKVGWGSEQNHMAFPRPHRDAGGEPSTEQK